MKNFTITPSVCVCVFIHLVTMTNVFFHLMLCNTRVFTDIPVIPELEDSTEPSSEVEVAVAPKLLLPHPYYSPYIMPLTL